VVTTWHAGAHVVHRERVPKSAFVRALEAEAADTRVRSDDEDDGGAAAATAPAAATSADASAEQPAEAEAEEAPPPGLEEAGAALEGGVSYWTDYAKAAMHARSCVLLPGLWHGAFACAGYGDTRDFASGEAAEEAHDRIRCAASRPAPLSDALMKLL
jgi:hypothetical protein